MGEIKHDGVIQGFCSGRVSIKQGDLHCFASGGLLFLLPSLPFQMSILILLKQWDSATLHGN